ncbi:hypothetical protein TRAPUB_8754 [Trametes pubescens]|uniref:Uncharacterized protein n=1 Tax=Trametes pubescens TaxID=154538 RepID=A0A1M2W4C4_TRAPU|nr:hypothetical protein TRAPUB_8754 [Trametes pubescens]
MSARTFSRRLFASLRTPASARAAARPAGRRFASTSVEHGAKQSSDLPWMIGSALVFGPAAVYLLTSSGKEKGKHNADAHHDKAAKAHAPSEELVKKEEAPAPAEDTEASKDEQPAEQSEAAPADDGAVTDDEGTTVSAKDVDASVKQASDSDSPADAQRAEEHDAKFSQGAPGQTAEAETEHEQKEKPGSSHSGTVQSEGDSGPTDLGDAREKSKSKQAPKEAAQD